MGWRQRSAFDVIDWYGHVLVVRELRDWQALMVAEPEGRGSQRSEHFIQALQPAVVGKFVSPSLKFDPRNAWKHASKTLNCSCHDASLRILMK